MTKWVKPSGAEIELNDEPATIEQAESLKWKRADASEETAEEDVSDEETEEAEETGEATDDEVTESEEALEEDDNS